MTIPETRARMIRDREDDIRELQAELDVLRGLESKPAAPRRGNGEANPSLPLPRGARQAILRKLLKDAGHDGLTRPEIIERMAPLCDSSGGSISGMLSLMARKRQIVSPERGRWRAKYARTERRSDT